MEAKINTKKTRIMPTNKGSKVMSLFMFAMLSIFLVNNSYAQNGEALFKENGCAACHHPSKDMTGPKLEGAREKWTANGDNIVEWVKNPASQIEAGVKTAVDVQNYDGFEGTMMPPSSLSDDEITAIFDYIDVKTADAGVVASSDAGETTATADAPAEKGGTNALFWVAIIGVVVLLLVLRYKRKIGQQVEGMGIHPNAHDSKNFPAIFMLYSLVALGIIYLLSLGFANNVGKINAIFFGTFPYVAFALFIGGSIYRYKQKGYKVSSLSTQFLEGKKLFWGSQPFHWGLMVLFFGHLIAFLFPSSVIAWNGSSVRLLILELSSFAFALLALLGLVLLIKRRLSSRSLMVVSNKMDMVVYVILFTQILSGLGVAFFVRWGSSWFASVLTPYLRSIFSFNPDIAAISQAPIWIQIHVISAFLIIAIIPFTRFMHFLVAPVDYSWRKYQLVVWNWNRKAIRQSKLHTFGKKPRNH